MQRQDAEPETRSDDGGSSATRADSADVAAPPDPPQRDLVPLNTPRDGVPAVVASADALARAIDALAGGHGPVAVDAERASGHRYGQRAFLVQLRREGAGTVLIDPAALPDLSELNDVLSESEWVLHAASQDLPCLAEVGLRPRRLFDTELGCRLAGMPRVGLAAAVEELLGLSLAKEHSAVDWSKRPLPEPWLRYAALDVEVLIDLRDAVEAELSRQGKLDWAQQEFAALVKAPAPPPRVDPWRRTSGMHRIRSRRQLAMLRELWLARDAQAQISDVSPGRLIPDSALIAAVAAGATTPQELLALREFTGRGARRYEHTWAEALARGKELPEEDLPPQHLPSDSPPPQRTWPEKNPDAAERLRLARIGLTTLAQKHRLPIENLLTPDTVRRLAWSPPTPLTSEAIEAVSREAGARPWQVALTTPVLLDAFVTAQAADTTPVGD